ncbi:FAD-dependent oxidoreductase [Pseudobacter ginsenosidimutans]|uniref:FAD-dependent oxidoreductase n=1 Tax=Pseudobacter ginsenosidimutans TaxID=661488 RepID=UPI001CEF7B07|nr:FAD-dependent oxidoreductase [Pseudobacter ginsenosidimutans]
MKPSILQFVRTVFRSPVVLFLLLFLANQQGFAKDFPITQYGAKPGLTSLNTVSINKAIEACFRNGGGRVIVPAGIFRTGTITMKDHVELHLEAGAVLLASTDLKDFPVQAQPRYRSQKDPGGWRALIYANEVKDIAITGRGTIDGNGAAQKPDPDSKYKSDMDGRPRNLLFISCNKIKVEGITMRNAGIWNQHYLDCEDVVVDKINVYNHANRNNDGIDIDGCRRFTLSNSTFDTDDDAIVLKSTGAAGCENVVITNCIVSSFCNGIKAGTESTGGFKNISISNCIIKPSSNTHPPIYGTVRGIAGLSLEIVDGGLMDGVSITNITIEGTDCPLYVRLGNRARKHTAAAPEPPVGRMRNIVISNVVAYNTGNYCSSITGIPGHFVENLSLSNIQFLHRGGLQAGAYIDDMSKVVEDEQGYPQPTVWKELPSSGLFIRHAKNIQVNGLMLNAAAADPRTPVMAQDVDGLQIQGVNLTKNFTAPVFFKGDKVNNVKIDRPLGWNKQVWQVPEPALKEVDVCVYGGSSAGVMAAYSARKMGKTVVLIEPGKHVGGLTSGGLGYTDIGNKFAISGLSLDFYRRLGKHYGNFENWIFEPSVAEKTFKEYLQTAAVPVLYEYRLKTVQKEKETISSIIIESSSGAQADQLIKAKMFIDCSYEGDLMANAGVSYTVGRESNEEYKETYNGVQLMDGHQFPDGIDPYKIKGDTSSGLLWGISSNPLIATGSGDQQVQAYNYRICLSNDPANRIAIRRPADYDSSRYELLLRFIDQANPPDLKPILKIDLMPNNKTDINNKGPFSTDMIGMNHQYPEADYATRERIRWEHESYTKGLLYFIGHDPRVPQKLREQMLQWGYPKDEYEDNDHWSPQLYVREARRMKGAYVMTQANCEGRLSVDDGVAMAAYTMDSHNCQRIIIEKNGTRMVKNEGNVEVGGFGPYPIAYRSVTPKQSECSNLLVPVCLSASHIAYGSIRMEPVFMVLAQSSAIAASLAIDQKIPVQQVDAKKIQKIMQANPLLDGTEPDILVDDSDSANTRITGSWKKQTRRSYGPSMLVNDTATNGEASVLFIPAIKKTARYSVYTYLPKLPGIADEIQVEIHDGKKTLRKTIKPHEIKVAGQTSGEWIWLGDYDLSIRKAPWVRISGMEGKVW